MLFQVIFNEASEACQWYAQSRIGGDFLDELERTSGFFASNPDFYSCAEVEIRRANRGRFPYSLFYVIDGDSENVLSCFHQHREPESRWQLLFWPLK